MPSTQISLRDETFETLTAEIPLLPLVVRHDFLMSDSVRLVTKVFPTWNVKDLSLVQCKDGITNKCKSYLQVKVLCLPNNVR